MPTFTRPKLDTLCVCILPACRHHVRLQLEQMQRKHKAAAAAVVAAAADEAASEVVVEQVLEQLILDISH